MTSAFGHEEKLIKGIERVLGPEVKIFGGASGDDDLSGQWRQLSTDQVYHNGVVVTVFYTDLKIGHMFMYRKNKVSVHLLEIISL